MRSVNTRKILCRTAALTVLSACLQTVSRVSAQTPHPAAVSLPIAGDVEGAHDPSIIKAGSTWYVFTTGKAPDGGQFAVRCSNDLEHWQLCGHVFDDVPAWIKQRSPGTKELWAPDISYVNGEYRLYYSYSLFGKNTSGIGLATNKTLDRKDPAFGWIDHRLVIESKAGDNYNAIDPNFVQDQQQHGWLSFGSFWDGIKMRRLDDRTGLLSAQDQTTYALARRRQPAGKPAPPALLSADLPTDLPPDSEAVEAPFIVFHAGFYYLVTSWDLCCRGSRSTYHTMVGRARQVTGPYLDKQGVPLSHGGASPLLDADAHWRGPGGASLLMHGGPHGEDLIVFHAYDGKSGHPALQLSTLNWDGGWPHAALEP